MQVSGGVWGCVCLCVLSCMRDEHACMMLSCMRVGVRHACVCVSVFVCVRVCARARVIKKIQSGFRAKKCVCVCVCLCVLSCLRIAHACMLLFCMCDCGLSACHCVSGCVGVRV